ncbi:30S ribosome-binding factor RbfA [Myceligenerans pegani]|uniref:Ribosome-binding factor A n=1 Tax=Myceligenerans pegani TaxID=2776917 RepID=A0ABR9MRV7_9MICO|nr:30S ribosome-binding factor RbfA [Myceligenerans sp. TRM 65318]MBE1874109.1 30S ribosome-binding factor RbfA [Myceligenerans sp. TRM 65318]MBE3016381.1 30S ribosome-binding factor RbfA [Myceligenerans sp. TRM 65318]
MNENPRARRLADRIKEIVARMLDSRIKDPRLGFVTITDVRVTGDLQNASVFYTVYGSDEDRAETAAALRSATGIIRSEVGKQTGVRLTPTIEFHLDAVPESAAHLDAALLEAQRRDAELARLRAGARHAGEVDPYKKAPGEADSSEHPVDDDER